MDELINRVAEKTGLAPEQARSAAEAVIGFLKEKLPAPIAGQLDGYIGGSGGEGGGDLTGQAGDLVSNLGGMFGGSKE